MPKKPPSTVVEHRISFQDKERALLEQYVTAEYLKSAGDVAVKGVAAGGVAVFAYGAYQLCKSTAAWLGQSFDSTIVKESWGLTKLLFGANLGESKGGDPNKDIGGRWFSPFWRFIPETASWEKLVLDKDAGTWSWVPEHLVA